MAKSKSRRKGRKTRRPTKTEIKRQKALERFILAIVTAVIFFLCDGSLGNLWDNSLQSCEISSGKFGLRVDGCSPTLFSWI